VEVAPSCLWFGAGSYHDIVRCLEGLVQYQAVDRQAMSVRVDRFNRPSDRAHVLFRFHDNHSFLLFPFTTTFMTQWARTMEKISYFALGKFPTTRGQDF